MSALAELLQEEQPTLTCAALAKKTGRPAELFQRLARAGDLPSHRASWREQSAFLFKESEFTLWWKDFTKAVIPPPEKPKKKRPPKRCWEGLPMAERGSFRYVWAPTTGRVYFAACENMIKIGYAANTAKRMLTLNLSSHQKIEAIGSMSGSIVLERYLHHKFRDLRSHGEWFHEDPRLIRFIRGVARINDVFRERYR